MDKSTPQTHPPDGWVPPGTALREQKEHDVIQAAIAFKAKVERDAPECFQPSPQLAVLFKTLEDLTT